MNCWIDWKIFWNKKAVCIHTYLFTSCGRLACLTYFLPKLFYQMTWLVRIEILTILVPFSELSEWILFCFWSVMFFDLTWWASNSLTSEDNWLMISVKMTAFSFNNLINLDFYFYMQRSKPKKQGTNLCSQIFSWGWKIAVVVLVAPPFLNYASLKNEEIHLQPEGK